MNVSIVNSKQECLNTQELGVSVLNDHPSNPTNNLSIIDNKSDRKNVQNIIIASQNYHVASQKDKQKASNIKLSVVDEQIMKIKSHIDDSFDPDAFVIAQSNKQNLDNNNINIFN